MSHNPYTRNPNYLLNPFNALYQDNTLLSNKPEIQELNQYALDLEDQIPGDFNLNYLTFEFAYNQLGFVRNGLLLAKIKFFKLYKNYGDGTFASFCKLQLRKQRWQINDTINYLTYKNNNKQQQQWFIFFTLSKVIIT